MVRATKVIVRMLPPDSLHQLDNPDTKDDQGAVVPEQVLSAIKDARPHDDEWRLIHQLQRNMRARVVPQGRNGIRKYQSSFLKEMQRRMEVGNCH